MNKTVKLIFSGLILLMGLITLTSCGSVLDTTVDEINQRYKDNNPMFESDVIERLKEPLNVRRLSTTKHVSIWVPNYDDIELIKQDIENGKEVIGIFVTFE